MRKLTPLSIRCTALVLLAFAVTPLANAAYIFTALIPTNGNSSTASGVNDAGQAVGSSFNRTSFFSYDLGGATSWNSSSGGASVGVGLATLGGGSAALGINNSGQIAGYAYGSTSLSAPSRAAQWNGSTLTNLGTAVASSGGNQSAPISVATATNDAGLVAGYTNYVAGSPGIEAAVWNGATITRLLPGMAGNSYAYGINNAGYVVGSAGYTAGSSNQHASLWNASNHYTDLGTLGGAKSFAYGINDSGEVVGTADLGTAGTSNGLRHATAWNGTTATDLGTLGGDYSAANAINTAGQIVGFSLTTGSVPAFSGQNYTQHATLWDSTGIIDLNSFLDDGTIAAGWELISANDINDKGWIVGNANNTRTGTRYGFMLSLADTVVVLPVATVPEPATYTMLLVALGLLGFRSSRRKNFAA